MRKFVSIFIIFALMISSFDIIDVNDITLNGKEIFTTDNACADHDEDDLSSTEVHLSVSMQILYDLPAPITFAPQITNKEKHLLTQEISVLPHFNLSPYRPPIA